LKTLIITETTTYLSSGNKIFLYTLIHVTHTKHSFKTNVEVEEAICEMYSEVQEAILWQQVNIKLQQKGALW